MTASNPLHQTVISLVKAFRTYFWLWAVPTVAFTTAATAFTFVTPTQWKASQALVVRDEARGMSRQGRFDSTEAMRAFQETIVEVAKSSSVVSETLKQLGSSTAIAESLSLPTDKDVQEFQEQITIGAPKGSELGTTEVLYLSVVGKTPAIAIERTVAVCDQLQKHLGTLRNVRAGSVTTELQGTLNLAIADLDEATAALTKMECEVGRDLAELRVLNQSGSGDGNLRTALNQVKAEIRQRKSNSESQQQLKQLLIAAIQNPDELLTMSSSMFVAQPSLKRLKDGLVDAQLRTSDLRGKMSLEHPLVRAAVQAEEAVRENLRSEVTTAFSICDADIQVTLRQLDLLTEQRDDLQTRLDRLAGMRASYAALVNDAEQRTSIVQEAKQNLANARATQSSSRATSLISRFQSPQVGDSPVGPGNATIIGVGLLGGFLTGAGLVFLAAPIGPNAQKGRRLTDYLGIGRREADRQTTTRSSQSSVGRRANEQPATQRATDASSRSRRNEDTPETGEGDRRQRRQNDDN